MAAHLGGLATRPCTSEDSASVAALVQLVRGRPEDTIDPFPPCIEAEVLADGAARLKEPECRARVAVAEGGLVGYAALDYCPELRDALLIGPVIHPDCRRSGRGTSLLVEILRQARLVRQRRVRASVGAFNNAAQAFLRESGFVEVARHTCLRLPRVSEVPFFKTRRARVARAKYDHTPEVHAFVRKFVPRTERQTRSLLKSDSYAIFIAYEREAIVGFVEVDMRFGEVATIEQLQGKQPLLGKGLGVALMAEGARCAFAHPDVRYLDFVIAGDAPREIRRYTRAGFLARHDVVEYAHSL